MNLTYSRLKELIPHLNVRVVTCEDIYKLFEKLNIELCEIPLRNRGYYVRDKSDDYVFIKRGLNQYLFHETLLHEAKHAFTDVPIENVLRKQDLQAEIFTTIALMPYAEMRRLEKIKHSLDVETYELLKKRLKIYEVFKI